MPRLSFLPPESPSDSEVPTRGTPKRFALDVRASPIDGQGAFAAEAIPARRKIGEIRGEAISAQEANHSCRPNATLRVRQGRVEFYAMRDVAVGEEITVAYGETHHQGRLRCRCGVPGCTGRL
jgi:SET domain-containing protein